MQKLVKRLSLEVPVPLSIDSTEPDVIEAALKTAPGRCLINSTNLEAGEAKSRKLFALAKQYSAAVLALTIDEAGMAKTAQRKLEVAQRIYNLAVNEFGLKPEDLVFDDLTFTLATGDAAFKDSAMETLEGLRLIKAAMPGVHTALGVSNVAQPRWPATRCSIRSLYHAILAGLDMAIINQRTCAYAEIRKERKLAEDLIFDRHENALTDLIAYFDEHGVDESADDQKADL